MSAFQPEKDRKSVRMLPRFVTPSGKAALDLSLRARPGNQHQILRTTQLLNLLQYLSALSGHSAA